MIAASSFTHLEFGSQEQKFFGEIVFQLRVAINAMCPEPLSLREMSNAIMIATQPLIAGMAVFISYKIGYWLMNGF